MHTPNAAELYDVRTRHVTSDYPALDTLIPQCSRVLEVGAGTGRVVQRLLDRHCSVVAVEKCDDCVAVLNRRFGDTPQVEVIHSDFLAVPLGAEVDVVLFSFDVFSEFRSVEERIAALSQASRLLRVDGSILLFNTVITRPDELASKQLFTMSIGDATFGDYACEISCSRSPLFGISHCEVTYQPVGRNDRSAVSDRFTRALITRNELLTLLVLHPEVESAYELDAHRLEPITVQTEAIVHVLRRRGPSPT